MWIPQLPERLWWDHNAHYHRWVLRQLPPEPGRVLDVGCGAGRLACTLATRADHVDGLDRSPVMIGRARRRCQEVANLRWVEGDLLDPGLPLSDDGYDAITAVSSLHHMPLDGAVERLVGLLRPGGVLVVVGHYRPATSGDRVLELLALPANGVVGAALALRGRSGKPDDEAMPVLPPSTTLVELRSAIATRLPDARLQRGLFWRYLMTWRTSR
ncbi:MAG: class I SAM-dependent methyltransferase [Acidimicrobiales bacterium]